MTPPPSPVAADTTPADLHRKSLRSATDSVVLSRRRISRSATSVEDDAPLRPCGLVHPATLWERLSVKVAFAAGTH